MTMEKPMGQFYKTFYRDRTAHFRHQCRKTTALSCYRCLINTGVETFRYRLEFGPLNVSKSKEMLVISTIKQHELDTNAKKQLS
jgi:hypothetical protein